MSAVYDNKFEVSIIPHTLKNTNLSTPIPVIITFFIFLVLLLMGTEEVQNEVISKNISERHARALLSLTSDQQRKALREITNNNYTVQQTELFVQETFKPEKKRKIKVKGKGFSRNVQIARNTILQAIGLIEKTNMEVSYKEDDKENEYVLTIRIKK